MKKECNECKRELLLNSDCFYRSRGARDGHVGKCKECSGGTFTKYHELAEGEMFCKRCLKILPYNGEYFPVDKSTKTGLRNVCYICSKGNTGSARYGKRKEKSLPWSQEEDDLLKEIYADSPNRDIVEKFPNRTMKAMQDRAGILGLSKNSVAMEENYRRHSELMKETSHWIGQPRTPEEKEFLSLNMKKRWAENREEMLKHVQYERTEEQRKSIGDKAKKRGAWKGENNPRHKNPLKGEDNPRWLGGVTPLLLWLRNQIGDWRRESMEYHNYTCLITGDNFDEIHHLHSFREIVEETLEELKIGTDKSIESFDAIELERLRDTIIKNNNKYGLGVCLRKDVHKLFHDTYGYGGNTPAQFEEFKNSVELNYHLREGEVE